MGTVPATRTPRAGRDLPVAVGVGLGLGAVLLLALFVRKEAFVVLAAAAVALAVWELAGALATRHVHVPVVPLLAGGVATLVAAYAAGPEALLVAVALTCLGVLAWRLLEAPDVHPPAERQHPEPLLGAGASALRDVTAGVLCAAWLPLLAGFAMLMLAEPDGARRILVFVLLAVCSDIGGYAAGVLWGRHPMAPTVSPKKSWEGLAGSAVACLVAGPLAVGLLLDGAWWAGAVVGLAAVATATLGDLSESVLKRDLGIKDMGSLLPGHGGVLDRLDSLLPTAPVVWLLLTALVPA
ncbi:phosphatidate cytidylyltransferase [Quadrisphaera sp. DSM 44207]|uniref:phosphatidate cytidylyltransferase n=1 Tax=Quadrisphaera sp. DSM 44207 TaxID=1881057 RepID=UPI00088B39B7|nr:phosphatidate cytidylyltransferase [Quadrisphaera sp. DSM 44207]SDQ76389.1 phosphatidate cytidylyltransferase [Quadrisphaera sp. DSM 44207]